MDSNVGEQVLGETTRWRNDSLPWDWGLLDSVTQGDSDRDLLLVYNFRGSHACVYVVGGYENFMLNVKGGNEGNTVEALLSTTLASDQLQL